MKKLFCLLLVVMSLSSVAQSSKKGGNSPDNRFAGLDTTFTRVLKEWKAAGFAVAVVEKNKVVWSKGYGYRDLENKLPVTPNTQFAIGSCTKAFTSTFTRAMDYASFMKGPCFIYYASAWNDTIYRIYKDDHLEPLFIVDFG